MKKFLIGIAALLFATSLATAQYQIKAKPKFDTETDAQLQADLDQWDQFLAKHPLFATCGRTAVGQPWFARLYDLSDIEKKHWEVEGYPTLASAIQEVEKDFLAYPEGTPKGYVDTYKK